MAGEVEVAEDGEGQCAKIGEIDAAESFQEEGAVVEGVAVFVGEGEDEAAEQEEKNDGLMAGDEEP